MLLVQMPLLRAKRCRRSSSPMPEKRISSRPEDPSALSDEEWEKYLFIRDNPRGRHHERWRHSFRLRANFSTRCVTR